MLTGEISADDRAQILDLLGRYLWAVDTGDHAGVIACFTADGAVSYDSGQRYEGRAELGEFATRAIGDGSMRGRMHLNHPLFFRRDGEHVILRSYMVPVQTDPMPPNGPVRSMRYTDDTFVRGNDGWKLKERAIANWGNPTSVPGGRKM